jgi:hypothetical protein
VSSVGIFSILTKSESESESDLSPSLLEDVLEFASSALAEDGSPSDFFHYKLQQLLQTGIIQTHHALLHRCLHLRGARITLRLIIIIFAVGVIALLGASFFFLLRSLLGSVLLGRGRVGALVMSSFVSRGRIDKCELREAKVSATYSHSVIYLLTLPTVPMRAAPCIFTL